MMIEFFPPLATVMVLLAEINRLWYAAPLIVSISLVYAGTRHESPQEILSHAARFGGWVLVFMAVVTAVLQLMWWMEPYPNLFWWWVVLPAAVLVVAMIVTTQLRAWLAKKTAD